MIQQTGIGYDRIGKLLVTQEVFRLVEDIISPLNSIL